MFTRALILSGMLAALAAAGATAATPRAPRAQPVQPVTEPPSVQAPAHPAQCLESYSNIAVANGFYFPAGANVAVLDDLHLGPFTVNGICAFDVGYYKEPPGTTDATVTFYANNPGDDPPAPVLASFTLPGLPSGENGFHIEVPVSSLSLDTWMAVSFNTVNTGLLLAQSIWPGASDDWFFMTPPGQYYNFGGNPKADFLLGIYAAANVSGIPPEGGGPIVSGFHRDPAPSPSPQGVDLEFAIRNEGRVRLDVVDVSGRVVAVVVDRPYRPGVHAVSWNGTSSAGGRVAAGVYLMRLVMPGFAGSRKVVLMR
ncbi:MAG TPA: hypothetical protein VJY35_04065 [Candidatus Eisenbacteria bacterium]|nr:hypothetical protein [Candidatus Eisenbacteria bacterium]